MTAKQTVAGTWLMSVLEQFEAQNMAINSLPDATWLLEASERNPTRPLQMQAVRRIWHQAAKLNGDPLLGIRVGLNLSLQAVNVIAWIAIHSPTLRQSLVNSIRYQSLVSNSGIFELQSNGDRLRVIYSVAVAPVTMHETQIDSVFAGLLRLLRVCRSIPLKPEVMALPGAKPQLRMQYEELLQCTVIEAIGTPFLEFNTRDLDQSYSAADPHLLQMALRRAEDMVHAQQRSETLVDHVRAMIDTQGVANATCQSAANAMNMSVRTLQRRLEAGGSNFRRILEATRMEHALRLLADSTQPLSHIAEALGYSDQSGLSHAVRAHWGLSPRELREEMLAQRRR